MKQITIQLKNNVFEKLAHKHEGKICISGNALKDAQYIYFITRFVVDINS